MRKIIAASLVCLLCSSAAFGADAPGFTAGFSRDDAKNVVTDSVYKLMWQDGEEIFKGDYDEAVKYCENLSFAGFSDWRLPTINELISITDKNKFSPAINKAFKHIMYKKVTQSSINYDKYWSLAKLVNGSSLVWTVGFRSGFVYLQTPSDSLFIRCVRRYN
ncbi:DUF1566 domain-containing protein [Campylobacter showae]|uniref:Lcl C-terminal domain-containing protein n=1 Tax=Campylobacter showae TaxID=204 RepID=UPI0028D446CC|nr:DUF1566 domain-containing protein [Campylobacter showae]